MGLQLICAQDRTRKSQQQQQQQQQIFPQVRGRCGPRFTLPSGAPTRCEAGWVRNVSSRLQDNIYDQWSTEWRPVVQPEAGALTLLTIVSATTVSTTSGRKVRIPLAVKTLTETTLTAQKMLPPDLPLVDDNSDFTLHGYQNFLIEPKARSGL